MARYKKEVKLSDISSKSKNRVRKRFGDIVVFELDNDREKLMLQKFQEVDDLGLESEIKNLVILHSALTIFTNIRIDVEDDVFAQILADMPMDLKGAILEIEMMIAHCITGVTQQLEHMQTMEKFKAMLAAKSDSVE